MDFFEKLKIVQIMMGKQWGEITIHQRALILQGLASCSVLIRERDVGEFIKTMDEEIAKILGDSNKIVLLSEGSKIVAKWGKLY